jgi:hypothetical protein
VNVTTARARAPTSLTSKEPIMQRNHSSSIGCAAMALATLAGVGCGAAPASTEGVESTDAPLHPVTSVRVGPDGKQLSSTAMLTHAEFLAMNARRRARQHGLAVPPMPERTTSTSSDIGEVQSALAIVVTDCESWDSTWINSETNLMGARVCLQFYSPGPEYDPYPYRSDFRVQSIATGNTAAMLCNIRYGGYDCEWDLTQFPHGERFCDLEEHDDLNGADHPQDIYWVQMPPWGACDPT